MKKVLLVGSSFSASPLFFALKKRGFHVTVCGAIKNDPCHQYADASLFVDYSSKEKLLAAAREGDFDYLVPTCNDYSYISAAWVAEICGFPGFDTMDVTRLLHSKPFFRVFAKDAGLPSPAFERFDSGKAGMVSSLKFPLLVKPADSFSGRGVTRVDRPEEIETAVSAARAACRSGDVIVEEFVQGSLHSHSAFLRKGRILLDFFVDEFCTVYPWQVNCSNHPSGLSQAPRHAMREAIELMASRLGLADGLLHTQFIHDKDRVWIVECMRRSPGDLYGQFVSWSSGVDYADMFVRPFIGEDFPEKIETMPARFMGRHTVSVAEPRTVFSFSHSIPAKKVRFVPLKSSGEMLGAAPFDKFAILFAEFDDPGKMLEISPRFADYVVLHTLEAS